MHFLPCPEEHIIFIYKGFITQWINFFLFNDIKVENPDGTRVNYPELAYRTEIVSVDDINSKIGIKWVKFYSHSNMLILNVDISHGKYHRVEFYFTSE